MEALIHVANVMFLCSFLVKDILWLRCLSVLGGFALIASFCVPHEPMWGAIAWNVLFSIINGVQIYRLLLERRPVRLGAEESELYQRAFRALTPREFVRLLGVGSWDDAAAGARLVTSGAELGRVMVLFGGSAEVVVGDRSVATLRPGQLVGEMSFVTGDRPNADVVAVEAVRFVSFPKAALAALFEKHPDLRAAFQLVVGRGLADKLRAA